MTTPAKLYGKDLSEYDEVDVDELLAQLSAEEIKILAKEVDPDVSTLTYTILLYSIYSITNRVKITRRRRVEKCRSTKIPNSVSGQFPSTQSKKQL